jgi:energy-coupling factor transport system substrate-specific component
MKRRVLSLTTQLLTFLLGFLSLLAPFVLPQARNPAVQNAQLPVMVSFIMLICLILAIFEAQTSVLDARGIAWLGILIAINAGLRFFENAIPGPGGFSAVFLLIILTGYFMGGRIGFLMGTLTMFVSAIITGGVGPWLPGQMITAGWVGQSAALLGRLSETLKVRGKSAEIFIIAFFGALWGMLYGGIMNLWFWPFMAPTPGQNWSANAGIIENIAHYFSYYLATSLVWDITRAIGNVVLTLILARSILKVFQRFVRRFSFQYMDKKARI